MNVQRELWRNFGVMVGYFGSKGDHLRVSRNLNQFAAAPAAPRPSALSAPVRREPDPSQTRRSATSREVTSLGYSRYNGALGHAEPALLGRTAVQRVLHAVGVEGHELAELGARTGRRAAGQHQHRGRLRALRLRRPAPLRPERDLGAALQGQPLVEGWQLGIITQGQTGNPINILTNLNFTATRTSGPTCGPIAGVRPSRSVVLHGLCDPRIAGSCTRARCFALPAAAGNHFGNLPRNAVTGPGFYNTDLSIIKRTRVGGATVEFRAEAFNVFNHPNLGFPPLAGRTATVGSTSFGVITATRLPTGDSGSARQLQFALKFLF